MQCHVGTQCHALLLPSRAARPPARATAAADCTACAFVPRRLACGRRGAAAGFTRHCQMAAQGLQRALRGAAATPFTADVAGKANAAASRCVAAPRRASHVSGRRADDRRAAGHACRPRHALLHGCGRRAWCRCAPRSRLLGRPSCPWPPWPSRRRRKRPRRKQTRQARRPAPLVRATPLCRRWAAARRGERRNGGLRSHGHLP